MKLICVGKKVLNLRHMIIKEEWEGEPDDPPPGVVRVTMEPGRVLHFSGQRAEQFLRELGAFLKLETRPGGIEVPRATEFSTEDVPPTEGNPPNSLPGGQTQGGS